MRNSVHCPVTIRLIKNRLPAINRLMVVCLFLGLTHISCLPVLADDVIRIFKPHSLFDQRHIYNNAVLTAALDKTVQQYGRYTLDLSIPGTQRERALVELIAGERINVHIVPTRPEWEKKALPIRIPIAKGLLGYRLFLVNRQHVDTFSNIESIGQLKTLKAGLRQQWSTTKVMQNCGFNVVAGSDYEGLFKMLMNDRFDYFPRGVNEIFAEFESRREQLPEMIIEPNLALFIPMPIYIFVCPKYPQLAERIEIGLHAMIDDGSLDSLFKHYHADSIHLANLDQRRVFRVDNPFLSSETQLDRKEFWFDPVEISK